MAKEFSERELDELQETIELEVGGYRKVDLLDLVFFMAVSQELDAQGFVDLLDELGAEEEVTTGEGQ